VAKTDFAPGDIVIQEKPFTFVPFDGPKAQICYVCGKLHTMLRECNHCSEFSFCSTACHELWAPVHAEFECKVHQNLAKIAKEKSVDETLLKLAWRIGVMATLEKRGSNASYEAIFRNGSGSYEDVLSLVSHMEHYEGTEWTKAILPACEAMVNLLPAGTDFLLTGRDLLGICARINSNAHAVIPEERPKALGLFCALSQMNHSCCPNTTFSGMGTGPELYCRALRPIAAGEPLTISYIDLYQPRNDRRELLQNSKFFTCTCPRCTEPLSQSIDASIVAFNCTNKACLGILVEQLEPQLLPTEQPKSGKKKKGSSSQKGVKNPSTPILVHKCTECGLLQPTAVLERKIEEITSAFNTASELYSKGTPSATDAAKRQFEAILTKYGASSSNSAFLTLVDDHWLLFNTAQRLTNCCVRSGDVVGAIRALKRVVASSKRILPPNEPETANYLMSLAECVVELEASSKLGKQAMAPYLDLKRDSLAKSLEIRVVALGSDHLLTKQTRELMKH
jgi:SET and MYND domain-containing protein